MNIIILYTVLMCDGPLQITLYNFFKLNCHYTTSQNLTMNADILNTTEHWWDDCYILQVIWKWKNLLSIYLHAIISILHHSQLQSRTLQPVVGLKGSTECRHICWAEFEAQREPGCADFLLSPYSVADISRRSIRCGEEVVGAEQIEPLGTSCHWSPC